MQTATAEILLNGELSTTVVKPVTAPEAVVLRHLHGNDALVNVKFLEDRSVSNAEEIERLKMTYGDDVFAKVFPGALPSLPVSFAAAGIEAEGVPTAKTFAKSKAD